MSQRSSVISSLTEFFSSSVQAFAARVAQWQHLAKKTSLDLLWANNASEAPPVATASCTGFFIQKWAFSWASLEGRELYLIGYTQQLLLKTCWRQLKSHCSAHLSMASQMDQWWIWWIKLLCRWVWPIKFLLSMLFVSSTARCSTAVRTDLQYRAAQKHGRVIAVQQDFMITWPPGLLTSNHTVGVGDCS